MPSNLNDPLKVITDALTEQIEDEPRVVEEKDAKEQSESRTKSALAYASNAQVHAGDYGKCG